MSVKYLLPKYSKCSYFLIIIFFASIYVTGFWEDTPLTHKDKYAEKVIELLFKV